ncbi:MAG: replication initiator protein A [Lachnospiraceae bacterium]|nr:replication initiator protein A [Lachnospiraceae bacterium]
MKSNIVYKHICKEDTYMFNYTKLPNELFTIEMFSTLSLHAKVLYSFMLHRISMSKENNWIDDCGNVYIYFTSEETMQKFNCSNKTAAKIMSELEEIGLIEKKRQGQGKPDIIYVNKFSEVIEEEKEEPEQFPENKEFQKEEELWRETSNNSEVNNLHFQKCKNYTSRNEKSTPLEVNNLHASNKEKNNKEILSSSTVIHESIRLLEEEEEKYKERIRYHEAEQEYSAQIAKAAYDELAKRDQEYRNKFTALMFAKVCKTIAKSKAPILHLSGFINWCYDNIRAPVSGASTEKDVPYKQWNQFMHQNYDFDALEKEILSN